MAEHSRTGRGKAELKQDDARGLLISKQHISPKPITIKMNNMSYIWHNVWGLWPRQADGWPSVSIYWPTFEACLHFWHQLVQSIQHVELVVRDTTDWLCSLVNKCTRREIDLVCHLQLRRHSQLEVSINHLWWARALRKQLTSNAKACFFFLWVDPSSHNCIHVCLREERGTEETVFGDMRRPFLWTVICSNVRFWCGLAISRTFKVTVVTCWIGVALSNYCPNNS